MKKIVFFALVTALTSCSSPPSGSGHSQADAIRSLQAMQAAQRANKFIDDGAYSNATAELTQAIESYPTPKTQTEKAILGTFYADRGLTFQRRGQSAKAMNDFNEAIKIAPNAPGPHAMRGIIHLKNGDRDFAKGDLQQALRLNPQPKLREEILQIMQGL